MSEVHPQLVSALAAQFRKRRPERLSAAARLLDAMQERVRPGDRVITGAVVQVPVTEGDTVVADFGPLGRVRLAVVRE